MNKEFRGVGTANIKHAAIDLSIAAIAVAAALGWSASLPGHQLQSLEVDRIADVEPALTTTEEKLALTENLATEAMVIAVAIPLQTFQLCLDLTAIGTSVLTEMANTILVQCPRTRSKPREVLCVTVNLLVRQAPAF
ncbi:MAG: hypothetical protein AB4050_19895 [Synechococcus sp.]